MSLVIQGTVSNGSKVMENYTVFKQDLEADVVVVGGGGTGLAAAVAAAEKGAKVIVMEKRETLGGNSVMTEGLFAIESSVQRRTYIDARSDYLNFDSRSYGLRSYFNLYCGHWADMGCQWQGVYRSSGW